MDRSVVKDIAGEVVQYFPPLDILLPTQTHGKGHPPSNEGENTLSYRLALNPIYFTTNQGPTERLCLRPVCLIIYIMLNISIPGI